MTVADFLIVILLIGAVARGARIGLLRLLLSSVGFVGGLAAGSWLSKPLAVRVANPSARLIIILAIELGLALGLAAAGEIVSVYISSRAMKRLHLDKVNQVLGGVTEILFTLLVVWLVASALVNVRSYNIGTDVRRSWIINELNAVLPRPPDLFARLEKVIDPNGFPNVFLGLEPQHTTVAPTNSVNNQAVLNDEKSVVKVQGTGCGGIVDGSGFVVADNVVVTNAHVVAGIARPEVVDAKGVHRAVAIWFDPNMDIAVLRLTDLAEPPLPLSEAVLPDNNAAAVLGFPGGGPLVANNAVIIDHITAVGRNIYSQGVTYRKIYEVQTDVEPGNSGGPLLAPDGSVAGIVFAKSVSQNAVGYALLINQVEPLINQAERQNRPVSTGSCAQD